jgi:hypothetical protein
MTANAEKGYSARYHVGMPRINASRRLMGSFSKSFNSLPLGYGALSLFPLRIGDATYLLGGY